MRVAVAGLGFMGLTHLKGFADTPGVEVAAVSSNDPKALSGDLSHIQGNLGVEGATFDFSRMEKYEDAFDCVRRAQVDAVDLCLPTSLHAPVTIAALEAGKHVLVEKPMALDVAECRCMIDASRAAGRILMCAQVLRFFPHYETLAEAFRGGLIGAVRHALFRRRCAAPGWGGWLRDRAVSGGGVFDLLIHDVDQMQFLFGAPRAVSAWGHEDLPAGIDLLTAVYEYEGFSVTITGGWHHLKDYPFSMECTIVGDAGLVDYSSEGRTPSFYAAGGGYDPLWIQKKDGYQSEIEYFVECCRENRQPEICPPEASLNAVGLMRLAELSRSRNGEKVPCTI